MAINRLDSLKVTSDFSPQAGAISPNDNANTALEKLQGSKANLISSPTNGNIVTIKSSQYGFNYLVGKNVMNILRDIEGYFVYKIHCG